MSLSEIDASLELHNLKHKLYSRFHFNAINIILDIWHWDWKFRSDKLLEFYNVCDSDFSGQYWADGRILDTLELGTLDGKLYTSFKILILAEHMYVRFIWPFSHAQYMPYRTRIILWTYSFFSRIVFI